MNAKKKQLLVDFPWDEHYPRLVAFTEWVIQGKNWNSESLPKGQTAESIVQDVIEKTFSEKRDWDPERGDLLMWLKWVIKSEISHLAKSVANQAVVQLGYANEDAPSVDGPDIELRQPISRRLVVGSPEEMVMDAETEADKTANGRLKIDSILEACSGHPELDDIVYAIIAGQCDAKPRNLAEFLGRPVEEIYQNLRTLRRRADKIRMEAQNGRR